MKLMFKSQEYGLKLDSYYFNSNLNSIVIRIKIRNKRVIEQLPIFNILNNKRILSNLHPIDLCILGVLANNLTKSNNNTNHAKKILDGFAMVKISPYLEIISRNLLDEEGELTLRLKHSDKVINITLDQLYNNTNLLNALEYQDALTLGCAIGATNNFHEDKIIQPESEYYLLSCVKYGLFLCVFMIAFLTSTQVIYVNLWGKTTFHLEVLLLPLIALIQHSTIQTYGFNFASKIYLVIMVSIIVFILYFGIIIEMPYPQGNMNTVNFNSYFNKIQQSQTLFVMSLLFAIIINLQTLFVLDYKFKNLSDFIKKIVSYFSFIIGYFLASFFTCYFYNQSIYSFIHYYYCILFLWAVVFGNLSRKLFFA